MNHRIGTYIAKFVGSLGDKCQNTQQSCFDSGYSKANKPPVINLRSKIMRVGWAQDLDRSYKQMGKFFEY